jgi:hypothetical protein
MSRADPFFRDFFVKAFFGGSFFDRIYPGEDYEVFLIFWRSNNLNPMNHVPTQDRAESDSPELRVASRDKFSRALFEMGFLVRGDRLSAYRFSDWFNKLAKFAAAKVMRLPPGFEVSCNILRSVSALAMRSNTRDDCSFNFILDNFKTNG